MATLQNDLYYLTNYLCITSKQKAKHKKKIILTSYILVIQSLSLLALKISLTFIDYLCYNKLI